MTGGSAQAVIPGMGEDNNTKCYFLQVETKDVFVSQRSYDFDLTVSPEVLTLLMKFGKSAQATSNSSFPPVLTQIPPLSHLQHSISCHEKC